jgi:hypothetical protein
MAGLSGLPGLAPQTQQGNLNKVSTHLVVASFPALSVNASFMGKSMVKVTLDSPFVQQIPTATGIVNSPEPYVMGHMTVALLRSQTLANLWITQAQTQATLGTVQIFSDSTVFDSLTVLNCSITDFDPGAYDGSDPVVSMTISGTFPVNSTMWGSLTGILTTLV